MASRPESLQCRIALVLALLAVSLFADGARAQSKPKLEIVPQLSHAKFITTVAFSPDGARVLSGSKDKKINLWDVASGLLLLTFDGHSDSVDSVAFSPDGARVISGSRDGTLKLWEVVTGQLVRTFEGHGEWARSVAFSPDG